MEEYFQIHQLSFFYIKITTFYIKNFIFTNKKGIQTLYTLSFYKFNIRSPIFYF